MQSTYTIIPGASFNIIRDNPLGWACAIINAFSDEFLPIKTF